jgi:hypothetical protein
MSDSSKCRNKRNYTYNGTEITVASGRMSSPGRQKIRAARWRKEFRQVPVTSFDLRSDQR